MPPTLLPKTTVEKDDNDDNLQDDTESPDEPRPQDSRNFEFVNATGAMMPNAISQPYIRSHVMREANRLTYSARTDQSAGSSSAGGPRLQEPPIPQVQKFRISSDGLRPMLPSKRSRRGQAQSGRSSLSRSAEEVEEDEQQLVDQQPFIGISNSAKSATGGLISDSSFQRFHPYVGDDPLNTPTEALEQGKMPGISSMGSQPFDPPYAPLSAIGGEQIVHFNTLPIPRSHRVEFLLHHYQGQFIESVPLMMAVRGLWLEKAMRDTAFLFIKLCRAAGSLSLIDRSGDSVEALMFKNEAIKAINERLSQSPTHISEGTLSAVACIVSYEAVHGTSESVQIHTNGLHQMIKVRGGIESDNCCDGLKRLVAWADLESANALSMSPRLQSIDVLLGKVSINDTTHDSQQNRGLGTYPLVWAKDNPQLLPYAQVLDENVLGLIADLRRLTKYLDSSRFGFGSDQLWLSDAVYNVERGLMLTAHDFEDTPGIDQCCCIAGLIYVKCFLRSVNPNTKIVQTLHERLQSSISKLAEVLPYEPIDRKSRLLLWAFWIGASTSSNQAWYVKELASQIPPLIVSSWEDLEGVFKELTFPESFIPFAKGFWEYLVEARRQGNQERKEI